MNLLTRRSSTANNSTNPSPTLQSPAAFPHNSNSYLPVPPTASSSSNASSSSLHRSSSARSHRSGLIPSPRLNTSMLPPPDFHPPSSGGSGTASGSRSGSLISTPKILSRRGSTKEKERSGFLGRKGSVKGKEKAREQEERVVHPSSSGESQTKSLAESGSAEVIETVFATTARHPQTGRKMINQYLVLEEIGHGTHGVVRLGRDLSSELPSTDSGEFGLGLSNSAPLYAIKIVERVPKRKKLQTLRKGALGKTDGGKMMGESEIRKELAMFKKVNHPNIVKMREIIDDPEQSRIFMILEYCKGGEIKWREEDGWPAFTIARTREIFRDTLLGLEYLHHQGIIHRDIKPSNLLVAEDNRVKISDFGCSHYSEALRVSSAQPGPEGDAYVDDVELAKTAGSPAFFAPEMCYTGLDDEDETRRDSLSPMQTPIHELPGFTLRPPSMIGETGERKVSDPLVLSPSGRALQLGPTRSRDSTSRGSLSARPMSQRTHSSATLPRKQRLPITNAIDVWALGVTLYCLLFGKTPFDAPNEYLLMQVIPTQEYEIPPTVGKEQRPISDIEAQEALDLLSRLMEKQPSKRITLEQAKRHPFTLRGMADPTAWLLATDPHAQTFVTVSNEEVMSVVKSSTSFREGFRKGMKALGRKLHITGGGNRNRSRSTGEAALDSGSSVPSSSDFATTPNLPGTPRTIRARASLSTRDAGLASPNPGSSHSMSRRLSMLGSKFVEPIASPRRQTVQIGSSTPHSRISPGSPFLPSTAELMDRSGSSQTNAKSLSGHRPSLLSPHIASPAIQSPAMIPLTDDTPRSPRQMTSMGSLDKVKSAPDLSPPSSLQRRQSSDIDSMGRQRSPSNASSTGMSALGSKFARLLSRNSSRSRNHHRPTGSINGHGPVSEHAISTSDTDHEAAASVSAGTSPHDHRISLEEGLPRRSHETFDSGSYSSRGGGIAPSPDRNGLPSMGHWESRLRAGGAFVRRGSNLSEENGRTVYEGDVDWTGPISDDDDDDDMYDETPAQAMTPAAPNFKNTWAKELSMRSKDDEATSALRNGFSSNGLGMDLTGPLSPTAAPPNMPSGGILDLSDTPPSAPTTTFHPQPVRSGHPDSIAIHHISTPPTLDSIPDASPPAAEPAHSPTVSLSVRRPSTPGSAYPYHNAHAPASPTQSIHSTISEFGVGPPRSSSANSHRYGSSPFRKQGPERARSPLGREHREYDGTPPSPVANVGSWGSGTQPSPMRSPARPMGMGRSYSGEALPWRTAQPGGSGSPSNRTGSPSHPVVRGGFGQTAENDEEDEDEGLAISTASRRGRKSSVAAIAGRRGTLSATSTPPGTNGRGTPIGSSPVRGREGLSDSPAMEAPPTPTPQAASAA